jgi:hypothetical protein
MEYFYLSFIGILKTNKCVKQRYSWINRKARRRRIVIREENKDRRVYDKMPELHILTTMMDKERYDIIKENIKDSSYGFSAGTLLSGNYPDEVDKILDIYR